MKDHTSQSTFTDLEVRIFQRQDKRYPVEITLGSQQEFPRGFLAADILPWISKADPLADGQRLFETLLADPTLRSAWAEARGQAPQRRIRLRIDVNAAELHALPWELLREDTATLSADASTPFSRYLPVSEPWGGVVEQRPVRVLAVISNPDDLEDCYNLSPSTAHMISQLSETDDIERFLMTEIESRTHMTECLTQSYTEKSRRLSESFSLCVSASSLCISV
jgi:hypothetical protein